MTPPKGIRASIIAKIQENNERYKKMSAEEKRVTIAKDTITQLEAQMIFATRGEYLESDIEGKEADQVRDLLVKEFLSGEGCNVCGKGAIFVSLVLRENDLTLKQMFNDEYPDEFRSGLHDVGDDHVSKYSQRLFSEDQLDLIEMAFESGSNAGFIGFGDHFSCAEETLITIMKNIIDNNGTFKPRRRCGSYSICFAEAEYMVGTHAYCDAHIQDGINRWSYLKDKEVIRMDRGEEE